MKSEDSTAIVERKRRVSERLGRARGARGAGPMLAGGATRFAVAARTVATSFGGIGLVHELARRIGLPELIDSQLSVFRGPGPYRESDHVLSMAYNVLCGGRTLDDLELRRQDEAYLDALGAAGVPDPTTAGDFLRRFDQNKIDDLSEAINDARLVVWKQQPRSFFDCATIDVDGTICGTAGECKEGMDMSYKGIWGYAPLVVTLRNTGEFLYVQNRPGNRVSHEGCFGFLDAAVERAVEAGFRRVRLCGDGHFALTEDFDQWTERQVEFVFGLAAHQNLVALAEAVPEDRWTELRREPRSKGTGRGVPKARVKQAIVVERGYLDRQLEREEYTEIEYQPTKCGRAYRLVMLRKTIRVARGQDLLIPEVGFRFYITNASPTELPSREVIREANDRCNQENLIAQGKSGFYALRTGCDTLLANGAYMTIASLAWNLKAWIALLWPDAVQGRVLLRMEFRRFLANVIAVPCQVVRTGRTIVSRFLAWNHWLEPLLAAHERLRRLRPV